MKKLFTSTLVILTIILTLSSCHKLALPSMSAKFGETEKNFIFRTTVTGDIPNVGTGFLIAATTSSDITSGEYLALLIGGNQAKEYKLNSSLTAGSYECEAIYRKGGQGDTVNIYAGNTGTITIDKIDTKNKKISGTFSFNLVNDSLNTTISVTEGKFNNLNYTTLPTLSSLDFNL